MDLRGARPENRAFLIPLFSSPFSCLGMLSWLDWHKRLVEEVRPGQFGFACEAVDAFRTQNGHEAQTLFRFYGRFYTLSVR